MSSEITPRAERPDIYLTDEENDFSLRDILAILFRHQTKIIVFFAVVVSTVTIASFMAAETYESEAKLLIRVGRESVSVDPSVSGPTIGVSQNRRNEINTEIGILTSNLLLERVVDSIGPEWLLNHLATESEELPAMRTSAVKTLANNLTVGVEKNSHIIKLSLKAGEPHQARYTLEKLLELYLERHIEVHRTQASPSFFEEQSAMFLDRLKKREAELDRFRKKHEIASMEEQKLLLLSEISALRTTMDNLSSEIDSLHAKTGMLENDLRSRSAYSETQRVQNETVGGLKTRLIELKLEEVFLAANFHDDDTKLMDIREQIQLTEKELAKEEKKVSVTTGVDSNYQQLQLELTRDRSLLSANRAQLLSITKKLDMKKIALSRLTGKETELARLQRQLEIADQEYREYVDNQQRADIYAALDSGKVSNVSIVQPATLRTEKPRIFRNFLLSVLFGLFGGVGLAFLLEFFDDTLKTRDDINKRLGLPVLASFTTEEFRGCT